MKATYFIVFYLMFQAISAQAGAGREAIVSYIDRFSSVAVAEMHRSGVPASIKMAQAILESNAGQSYLATNANNHFGIKCGKNWTGKTSYRKDDDYDHKGELKHSCFRAYESAYESFMAHSDFLTDTKKAHRYGFLFDYDTKDYRSWAKGLKKAGYATNPKYPNLLISLIETYSLSALDQEAHLVVKSNTEVEKEYVEEEKKVFEEEKRAIVKHAPKSKKLFQGVAKSYDVREINGVAFIETDGDEKLDYIAKEMGIKLSDLKKYNEGLYSGHERLQKGTILFIEPKKSKFSGSTSTHVVSHDETIEHIAQTYGVCADRLKKRNAIPDGYQPKSGEVIKLKGKARKKGDIQVERRRKGKD